MKLSAEQIQYLFEFTEKKYVKYYDLQIELVDHLAERIQEETAANNNTRFETALQKVYNDFGIFGFAKVVQEKEQQVGRASGRRFWQEVKNLFRWPEIITVAVIAAICWQLTLWVSTEILFPAFFVMWFASTIFLGIKIVADTKRQKKKLLSLQFSAPYLNGTLFLFEWIFILNGNINGEYHNRWAFCVIATIAIIFKLAVYRAYKNIRKAVVALYPEAFA